MSTLTDEIARRRTFAIISHPDAGKTTLTEKLLLFGGAIQLAGEVKARGERRRTRSDWMAIERERGISVSSAVMSFEQEGLAFNLLDTPGHQDFSEDTYRTLTAVDSAVMVLDAAKGIEEQTRKLFEVCRLRDVSIITFVNKLDREARDPFDFLDEIEQSLALDVIPASWPIGMGRDFLGTYDLFADALLLFERGVHYRVTEPVRCSGLDDPKLPVLLPKAALAKLREEVEMAKRLCPPFDLRAYREGHLTPVYFGSARNNFGVRELLHGIGAHAPPPRPQPAQGPDRSRPIMPEEPQVAGFVFKVQANIDPQHRDRIAFVRIASGRFRRGMIEELEDHSREVTALRGLERHHTNLLEMQKAQHFAEEAMRVAERLDDAARLVGAHMSLGVVLYFQGKLEPALTHFRQGFDLFNPKMQFPDWPGSHPGVACQFWPALISWILGYPDRSVEELTAAVRSAETLGHPYTLAQTLCWAAFVHIFRHEPSAAVDCAGRALRICDEQRIAHFHAYALCVGGWALAASGESEKGLAQISQGGDSYGSGVSQHMLLALQADAQLAIGKSEAALASAAAGLEAVEKMGERRLKRSFIGSGERHCSPAAGR
jgi:peptide chain release factor 3